MNLIICSAVLLKQKILKFAATIYKMKVPLKGMLELVIPPQLICVVSIVSWSLHGLPSGLVWCAVSVLNSQCVKE